MGYDKNGLKRQKGGNMDFSSICQSSVVYLPVFHEGGYFYIGDGPAVQGDGEIAGNALETSLDVLFTIKVIKNNQPQLPAPRVEEVSQVLSTSIEYRIAEIADPEVIVVAKISKDLLKTLK